MTQRWKVTIEYDGGAFIGWQRQDAVQGIAVQGVIEDAIFSYSGERVTLHAAGRTDTGVHALGQVAHFDLEKPSDPKTIRDAINAHMRTHAIAIVTGEPVDAEFHARFAAKRRSYCYRIIDGRRARLVTQAGLAWQIGETLDLDAMNAGARHLIGTHDYSSFRAAECQAKSPVKSIETLAVTTPDVNFQCYGRLVEINVSARSFLHHQVRNITGTLVEVGLGKRHPDDVKAILDACDRRVGGVTAPACGLYFTRVEY